MKSLNPHNLREKDIIKIVCEFFSKNGFSCRVNHPIRKRGIRFIPDVLCERDGERVVVEIKKTDITNRRVIDQLLLYSRFLPDTKWYLCIPSSIKLRRNLKKLLEQNNIGLLLIENDKIKMVSIAASYADLRNRWTTSLQELLQECERIQESGAPIPSEREPETRASIDGFAMRIEPEELIYSYYNTLSSYQKKISQMDMLLGRSIPIRLRISSELLDYIGELENIGYSRELMKFEKKYRKATSFDEEYQLVLGTLKRLWTKYRKERGAIALKSFKEFEPLLREIPGYRDHMIHPFQVFLMGSIIIDKFYKDFQKSYKRKLRNAENGSLDFAWLLCSTFHDFCYPIQMYEFVNRRLFKKFLQIENDSLLPKLQTEKILLQKGQLKLVDQLVSLYCHCTQGSQRKWIFDSECKIDEDFRFLLLQEITDRKNHAPLSALTLLNLILGEEIASSREEYIEKPFSTAVCPAALAIALHDKEILKKLPKNKNILFEFMPLALLLIYCDTAQEFGRAEQVEYCTLKNFNLEKTRVETSLVFSKKSVYKEKEKEVDKVFDKLKSKSVSFRLRLIFNDEEYCKATGKPV